MDYKQVKVLLIEDNPADIALIREMLKESRNPEFKLYNTQRLEDGLNYIAENEIDVLLLDLNLPDSNGFDTFIKASEKASNIPVVILSALNDEDIAIKAVKGDAQDYLIKGKVESSILARSIVYAIERKSIKTELIKHRNHLEELVEERTKDLILANEKLKREIEERKRAEEEIKASLEEKKILLEEIHQRVENNLGTISNLIGLEYTKTEGKEPIDVYQENQNRVKAIALIHERLSRSEDFAIIDFDKYAHDLVNYLFKTYAVDGNAVNVNIKTNGILLDIDTAVPCGLIVNELITNSIKYAFKEKGKINISLDKNQGNFVLTISDDGIGLPDEVDFRYAETTGIQLVNALVRQLDGLIDLEKNEGTKFIITFKGFS